MAVQVQNISNSLVLTSPLACINLESTVGFTLGNSSKYNTQISLFFGVLSLYLEWLFLFKYVEVIKRVIY